MVRDSHLGAKYEHRFRNVDEMVAIQYSNWLPGIRSICSVCWFVIAECDEKFLAVLGLP